eukprot:1148707-Pelagomonas_calceolata.AAC.3
MVMYGLCKKHVIEITGFALQRFAAVMLLPTEAKARAHLGVAREGTKIMSEGTINMIEGSVT